MIEKINTDEKYLEEEVISRFSNQLRLEENANRKLLEADLKNGVLVKTNNFIIQEIDIR
jgi:HSP20 family molecular chaperone IbpA